MHMTKCSEQLVGRGEVITNEQVTLWGLEGRKGGEVVIKDVGGGS